MGGQTLSLSISSLNKSPKKEGIFERDIILKVTEFLKRKNYHVKEHVSINIAWGRLLSEIDLVALKDGEVTVVEVKSRKDKIRRAKKQLNRLRNLIDYCFIASDIPVKSGYFKDDVGILHVTDDVQIVRDAEKLNEPISRHTLLMLRSECLKKLCARESCDKMTKESMVNLIFNKNRVDELKKRVKKIVFCPQICDNCEVQTTLRAPA